MTRRGGRRPRPRSGLFRDAKPRRVNGWQLTTARIAGDAVVEVVLNGVAANRTELEGYGLSEVIISYKRRRFVAADEAPTVLPRLLAQRRPVRDTTAMDE